MLRVTSIVWCFSLSGLTRAPLPLNTHRDRHTERNCVARDEERGVKEGVWTQILSDPPAAIEIRARMGPPLLCQASILGKVVR